MKIKKGGYSVKNGFYIKNDCKNNVEDGSIDEDGYILDPLTYDRIKEGNLIQLSDGICYEKSKNLSRAIKNRNTLPFGHVVTSVDKKKLSSSQNHRKKKPLIISSSSDFDPDQELENVLRRQTLSPLLPIPSQTSSLEEEQPEITPVRRRRGRPPGSRNRTRRQTPILIIESDSPEEIGNSGRGTKKRNLKRKSKGKSKRKSKY
jgi:hypothetical protein